MHKNNVRTRQLTANTTTEKTRHAKAPDYHQRLNLFKAKIATLLPHGVGKVWGEALHGAVLKASKDGHFDVLLCKFTATLTAIEQLAQECQHLCHTINNEFHQLFEDISSLAHTLTKAENILGEILLYIEKGVDEYLETWSKGGFIWQS